MAVYNPENIVQAGPDDHAMFKIPILWDADVALILRWLFKATFASNVAPWTQEEVYHLGYELGNEALQFESMW